MERNLHVRYDNSVYKALTFFSQFTINMLVPIFLCSFIGYFIDKWLDTSFVVVILFFVGALAGFRNVYHLAKKVYSSKEGEKSFVFRQKKDGRNS